jgi:hypothetical protein
LDGLEMEDVGIFYGHLVQFTVFCYILWTFGIVRGHMVYFSRLSILYQEKSGNPGCEQHSVKRSEQRLLGKGLFNRKIILVRQICRTTKSEAFL